MKKVLLAIVVLSIVATSVFCLVACGTTNPNDFLKELKDSKEMTVYSYDEAGVENGKISINSKGEIAYIQGESEMYLIKENDAFVLYSKQGSDGKWNKATDASSVDEIKNYVTIEMYVKELERNGIFVENEDGYWYGAVDKDKKMGVKMEKGMLLAYTSRDGAMVKVGAIELKADVKLPAEAKK